MKSFAILILSAIALLPARASTPQQLPAAPVEARLQASNLNPFEKETVILTLEIISRDIEIDPKLDLAHLPEADVLPFLGPFEALAVQRERVNNQEITRRRYRAPVRPLNPGTIDLAPVLQLTSRKRVRSFFGSAMEVRPVNLQVPQIQLKVRPIPTPPEDFSGIIGNFTPRIEAAPLAVQAGDLVTITTTLIGDGWAPEEAIPSMPQMPVLRTYRVRADTTTTKTGNLVFSQTVVPLTETLTALPPLELIWFDTTKGSFQRDTFGPFPLTYIQPDPVEDASSVTTTNAHGNNTRQRSNTPANQHEITTPSGEPTKAYFAPAATSVTTFSIPSSESIQIIDRFQNWLLIEYNNNRGWIPNPDSSLNQ